MNSSDKSNRLLWRFVFCCLHKKSIYLSHRNEWALNRKNNTKLKKNLFFSGSYFSCSDKKKKKRTFHWFQNSLCPFFIIRFLVVHIAFSSCAFLTMANLVCGDAAAKPRYGGSFVPCNTNDQSFNTPVRGCCELNFT